MKDFFKIRTTASELAEEHGAGEQGTPALVSKYKNATPGQNGSAPTGQQPARKGDKLNAKFEPVKESAGAYEKDMDPKKPVYAQGVKGAKSTPFKKKFINMKAYDKWSDSDAAGDFDVQRVFQESVDEGINKDDPIAKEYSALMKKSIGDLRAMIKQQKKVVDVSGYTSKDQAASEILRAKHGNKKVAAAMGLDEGIMGKLKSFKRGMDARSKAADHFDKAGDPKNPNASKDLRRAVKYHNVVNKEETQGIALSKAYKKDGDKKQLVGKTVMRKRNFMSPDPAYVVKELFQQGKDWKWSFQGSEEAMAVFKIGKVPYMFHAYGADGEWEVEFKRDGKKLDRTQKFGLTGTGNSADVMSTVVDIMRAFLDKYKDKIQVLTFSAKEDSRQGLYARMVKRLLPDWTMTQKGEFFTLVAPT